MRKSISTNTGGVKTASLPSYGAQLAALAAWYIPRYVRRHFHAVRCDRDGPAPAISGPTVFFVNHSSWWDPAIGALFAARHYAGYRHYTPIDAAALNKYKIMKKLGFFPVDRNARSGARQFIEVCGRVFSTPNAILWLTPEGRFRNVRSRPVAMKRGIGHLPAICPHLTFVPMAIEYTFDQESAAEVAVRFGGGIRVSQEPRRSAAEWTEFFSRRLEYEMDQLAAKVVHRHWNDFDIVQDGTSGVGGMYDLIRRTGAMIRGKPFASSHGEDSH